MTRYFLLIIVFLLNIQLLSARREELYTDATMHGGIALLAPQAVNGVGVKIDTLCFEKSQKKPLWRLASWNFATHLKGKRPCQTKYGVTYTDDSFLIARNKKGIFTLQIDASKIYPTHRSAASQPWINFLMEKDFHVMLKECSRLTLRYSMRVLKCENRMDADYDTKIHAAQFLGYLLIRNNNAASADYGKYLWLGIGCYDNRYSQGLIASENCSWDVGTNTYIYTLPEKEIFGNIDLNDHQWHSVRMDVLQGVQHAIYTLSKKGFLKDSQVTDFMISSMNFGWELPGTFDVIGQVKGFSLIQT